MKTLVIDNYDSYTYNLYQMIAEINGEYPFVIHNDECNGNWNEVISHYEGLGVENIIISPGPGKPSCPNDFGICNDALKQSDLPILGVCLGHQGLAYIHGGIVTNAPHVMHGRISEIIHNNDILFDHIPTKFNVVRYHSLIVSEPLPLSLKKIAETKDGLIMAIKHKTSLSYGVQFHPEALCSEYGYQILQNFHDITKKSITSKCILKHEKKNSFNNFYEITRKKKTKDSSLSQYCLLIHKLDNLNNIPDCFNFFKSIYGNSKDVFWLDSNGNTKSKNNRFSYMGDRNSPFSFIVKYNTKKNIVYIDKKGCNLKKISINIMDYLQEELKKYKDIKLISYSINNQFDLEQLPFDFIGGFVGYLGYESLEKEEKVTKEKKEELTKRTKGEVTKENIEEVNIKNIVTKENKNDLKEELEDLKEDLNEGLKEEFKEELTDLPDSCFLFADRVVIFDHLEKHVYLVCLAENNDKNNSISLGKDWIYNMETKLNQDYKESNFINLKDRDQQKEEIIFQPTRCKKRYKKDIEHILEEIHKGETYEVCLTNHLIAHCPISNPLAFYNCLRVANPSPFSSFFKLEGNDNVLLNNNKEMNQSSICICSSSPERFFKMDKNGNIESKPIKGTRGRRKDSLEDKKVIEELLNSSKDRAENMMIADLVRNDLGRICEKGSVYVPSLMQIETYQTVHQMVTTIHGKCKENKNGIDVIKSLFPGGSMTGAPKKRTMKIIKELEQYSRGVYSGSLGYLSFNGSVDLNIVIRTAIIKNGKISIGSGGAIVALSDLNEEYEEMLLKTNALMNALETYKGTSITINVDKGLVCPNCQCLKNSSIENM